MGRRKPRRTGRPTLLTKEVEDKLVAAVRSGAPLHLAAQHAGIAVRTFEQWLQMGREAIEDRDDLEDPVPVPAHRRAHVDLVEKVATARADAAVRSSALIHRAAAGGAIIEETTRKYRDPETGQLVTETTVKRSAPDWRAAAWYLERSHRNNFGKDAVQVELTGQGGGPVQIQTTPPRDALVARLAEIAGSLPAAEGEVVEGEVVED